MGYTQISDAIGFGKYKDKTVWWVTMNDISYMQWMVNQDNLRAKLKCLPKPQKDLIQSKLNKARLDKLDMYEAWACSSFSLARWEF